MNELTKLQFFSSLRKSAQIIELANLYDEFAESLFGENSEISLKYHASLCSRVELINLRTHFVFGFGEKIIDATNGGSG